jgi:D-alanine-D-alanine ligase
MQPDIDGASALAIRTDPARVLILSNDDCTWTEADYHEIDLELARMQNGLIEQGYQTEIFTVRFSVRAELGGQARYDPADWLVFNWCEQYYDRPWTDTEIAMELEQLGYTFTGASAEAMRLSMDKVRVRAALAAAGVPLPIGRAYTDDAVDDWSIFPAIVKPVNQHSSYGISRASLVESTAELRQRVQWVLAEFGGAALVEEFVDGREIHVPMLGNARPDTLPPLEIDYSLFDGVRDRIYTNEAKFDKTAAPYYLTKFLCPAPLDAATLARVEAVARLAYRVAGCRDYGRIDLRLRDGLPLVLDVNPNADLTFESDHAIASKMLGWTYGQLAARIVECGLERWPRSAALPALPI